MENEDFLSQWQTLIFQLSYNVMPVAWETLFLHDTAICA